jgi:hypothetical protein
MGCTITPRASALQGRGLRVEATRQACLRDRSAKPPVWSALQCCDARLDRSWLQLDDDFSGVVGREKTPSRIEVARPGDAPPVRWDGRASDIETGAAARGDDMPPEPAGGVLVAFKGWASIAETFCA